MRPPPGCVRCGGPVRPPDLMTSRWTCEHHGAVEPLQVVAPLLDGTLAGVAARSRVPVWQLAPPPTSWTLGGIAVAGDDRGSAGVALGWSGPSPLFGAADLVVVSEEPAVGLGARYAGTDGLDAGDCVRGRPAEHVAVRGRPVALWRCAETPPDRTALVGEADGGWLWLVLWPAAADALLVEHLLLTDARERLVPAQRGAASPRLTAPSA